MGIALWMGLACLSPIQAFSIGPVGGANYSSIPDLPNTQTLTDLLPAWSEGLYLDFSLAQYFFLQTELRVTGKGTYNKEQVIVTGNAGLPIGYFQQLESISLNYLEIPVMLKLEDNAAPDWRVHVFGGPYIAYLVGAGDHIDTVGNGFVQDDSEDFNIIDKFNRWDYGLVFGVGLVFQKTFVDFRFDLGLTGLLKNTTPTNYQGPNVFLQGFNQPNLQNRTFSLLFGYEFF